MLLSGRRRCLAVPVIVALLGGLLPIGAAVAAVAALPKTIIVPGLVAATIQGGINIAASGDTVLVRPGVYHELLNFKGKSVRVVSQGGPATTTIDGGVGAPVVTFTSGEPSSTLLQGFTITDGIAGPFTPGGGIAVQGSSPTIFGNIITKNTTCGGGPGIEVQFGAPVIVANIVSHNRDGCNNFLGGAIEVFGGTAEIISNRVELNDNQTGIVIRAGLTPSVVANNIIEKNTGLNTRGLSATTYSSSKTSSSETLKASPRPATWLAYPSRRSSTTPLPTISTPSLRWRPRSPLTCRSSTTSLPGRSDRLPSFAAWRSRRVRRP
jgi:hypothetical protein